MTAPITAPITALEIGEQSAANPLGKFGAALIRKPVREGIEAANRADECKERAR